MPHTRLRKLIAEHMLASRRTSPHVTTVMEADMSAVVAHRSAHKAEAAAKGVVLTFTPYFIQAVVAALKAVPRANAVYREDGLLLKRRYHIGMATAIDDGLVVPVIHDADELSLLGLARTGQRPGPARPRRPAQAGRDPGLDLHHHQPRHQRQPVCHAHHQPAQRGYPGRRARSRSGRW